MAARGTLVVVPTYEEAGNIEALLRGVRAAVPAADILVVDDGSTDGTADLAGTLGRELGQIDVVVRPGGPQGLGTAYRFAFGEALARGYARVVQMDADLSHDPAELPALLTGLDEGAALVIGSRYIPGGAVPGWPLHRRLLSRWGNRYTRWMLGVRIADATSGYRAWRADAIRQSRVLDTRSRGYLFQIEAAYLVASSHQRVEERPIVFRDRAVGQSKLSSAVVREELRRVTWWGVRDRFLARLRHPVHPTPARATLPGPVTVST